MTYEHTLMLDIECRSGAEISSTGAGKYARDKEFDILMVAHKIDDRPTQLYDLKSGYDPFADAFLRSALQDPTILKKSYNAAFEWECFNQFGWETPIEQWQCTLVHAAYLGYPMGLEATGDAIGIPQNKKKLMTGKALIRYFCTPQKATKKNGGRRWNEPHHDPEKWKLFREYCMQDVEAEYEIDTWLSHFPMPESEWDLWRQETLMNSHGVWADRKLIEGALYIDSISTQELKDEARQITKLDNPNSPTQMLGWLEEQGCTLPNLQKATVSEALAGDLPDDVRRALEIRQQMGKTSNKKYKAAYDALCDDDRIRGLLQFYGANRTGRWSGRLLQVQNLPR